MGEYQFPLQGINVLEHVDECWKMDGYCWCNIATAYVLILFGIEKYECMGQVLILHGYWIGIYGYWRVLRWHMGIRRMDGCCLRTGRIMLGMQVTQMLHRYKALWLDNGTTWVLVLYGHWKSTNVFWCCAHQYRKRAWVLILHWYLRVWMGTAGYYSTWVLGEYGWGYCY